MNAITHTESNALSTMTERDLLDVLKSSLYPGAADASIRMVIGYCKAANLDPMQKPVHIVPMWDGKAGSMRDVVMPGVNLYRTQAARSGECAGVSEPDFGPDTTENIGGQNITFPAWCRVTTKRRLPTGEIVSFTAREFWKENYAVKGGKEKSIAPNAMWAKRPYGQIAKCAEAQALRKAFPEIASASTAEEMEGKAMRADEAPAPTFDYLDPAPYIAEIVTLASDAEAAGYWKANATRFANQPEDYARFKAAIVARRVAIKESVAKPAPDAQKAASMPVVTYAAVMDKMLAAKNLDALDVSADWIGEVADADQRAELGAKYEELKKGMTK